MGDDIDKNLVFKAVTLLDFNVTVTRKYWNIISKIKHPLMEGKEENVKEVLENPDEIRISRSDPNVLQYLPRFVVNVVNICCLQKILEKYWQWLKKHAQKVLRLRSGNLPCEGVYPENTLYCEKMRNS